VARKQLFEPRLTEPLYLTRNGRIIHLRYLNQLVQLNPRFFELSMTNIKRLYLLSESEIENLYARPDFNSAERDLYFSMNQMEIEALSHYATMKTKVSFMLQLAYFKAKHQFFNFAFEDVQSDVEYIQSKFFKSDDIVLMGSITRQVLNMQKKVILHLFDYQDFTGQSDLIATHLFELLRYYPKGHDTLRQLLAYLDNQKIIIPSYRTLQDLFTQAFSKENERLSQLVTLIPQAQQKELLELIAREDGISKLNIIRSDQKNFKYTACQYALKIDPPCALKIDPLFVDF